MKLMTTTLFIFLFSMAAHARSQNLDYVRSYFEKENTRTATIKPSAKTASKSKIQSRKPASLPKKKLAKKSKKTRIRK